MAQPLMPKATAVWLIDNTALSFGQISTFCGLHPLEVQNLADAETGHAITGMDPVTAGQLTYEEIKRCEADVKEHLVMKKALRAEDILPKKRAKYTPLSMRQDKPDAIAWIIKFYPNVTDHAICKLLGTTKNTVQAIRNKTHWNHANIKPKSPLQIGLCSQSELDHVLG